MRMSRLFSQTLRDVPAEAEIPSHQLLLRAGLVRSLAAGIYSYLPLGRRALTKIEQIIRAEMDAIGGQEITMPVVHPADIWQETGRWYQVGAEMARFKDRAQRDMVLGMTHEEVIADLIRQEIRSYRQLPCLLYQIQTKFRDEPRSRGGLIRVREFTMKDSYSLDADWEGLDKQYRAHYQAYFNIFQRCHLPVIAVQSDVGMMGGQMAHEYMYLTPIGEDTLVLCDACGYAANRQVAQVRKPMPAAEGPLPLERVATPGTSTIDDLAAYLGIPTSRTAKAVFFIATVADPADANATRRAICVCGGPWGHRPERDEADERSCSAGAAPGTRRGNPGCRGCTRVCLTHRTQSGAHPGHCRRPHSPIPQPRGWRECRGLSPPAYELWPRLSGGPDPGHCGSAGWGWLSTVRRRVAHLAWRGSGQYFQVGNALHRGAWRHVSRP